MITMTKVLGRLVEDDRRSAEELERLALAANRRLDGATAEQVIEWAVTEFGERFCVTSSMADAVLAHVASRVVPGIEVIFLDTGLHFAETLQVRDQVARTLPVRVISARPELTVGQQDGQFGARLFDTNPDECCALRKVQPLEKALSRYDAWAAGLRRDEGPSRARTQHVSFESGRGKIKVAPMAYWTQADVEAYIDRYDVPVNSLFGDGYTSIGCWPCTLRTVPGQDPRAGRWAMFEKTECGLHAA